MQPKRAYIGRVPAGYVATHEKCGLWQVFITIESASTFAANHVCGVEAKPLKDQFQLFQDPDDIPDADIYADTMEMLGDLAKEEHKPGGLYVGGVPVILNPRPQSSSPPHERGGLSQSCPS